MLIVPPSIMSSSCWFCALLVVAHCVDCESETDTWRGCSLLVGPDKFTDWAIGREIPLLATSGWCSRALLGTSLLGSDSTGFWVLVIMVGAIEMLFSSNFTGNTDPGPFFMAWEWPPKLWTRQWLFLCFMQTCEGVTHRSNWSIQINLHSKATLIENYPPAKFQLKQWKTNPS